MSCFGHSQFQENDLVWRAYTLHSDSEVNLYLAARLQSYSKDFRLLKYNSAGTLQWVRSKAQTSLAYLDEYFGPRNYTLDQAGNGYLTIGVRSQIKVVKFGSLGEVLWESGCVQNDWAYSSAVWILPSRELLIAGLTGVVEYSCDHCPNSFPRSIFITRFDADGSQAVIYLKDVTIPAYDWGHSYNIKYSSGGMDHIYATISTFLGGEPTDYYTMKFDVSETLALPSVSTLPKTFVLLQNYPNPFNPSTTVLYELPEGASVRLLVYDLRGRVVGQLAAGHHQPGYHEAVWDGHDATGRALP